MDCLIGMKFKDFVLIAADRTSAHSIIVMKSDDNKLHKLSDKLVMAVSGESGDTVQFAEYIAKNIQLYKMRNGYELSPKEAASFTRRNLADALRSRDAYHVNLLMAGFDEKVGPQLFFMDYLASMVELKYAVHGYGGYFALAILDRYHVDSLQREEALEVMRKCIREVHQRLVVNLPNFKVQLIDAEGIHDLPDITATELNTMKQLPLVTD